ncbi:MAG: hypothetical protein LBH38_02705 [Holosporales bacterium]|jgi:hypothetical protein|nr:hypothetical protein [Holosporales bacterium]
MGITYRHIKGAPLTSAEVDANFEDLDKRLLAIENPKEAPSGVVSIEQQETHIRFLNASGQVLGEIELPMQRFVPKGEWQTTQVYEKGDLVAREAHTWCAVQTHEATEFSADKEQGVWKMFL